MERVWYIRQTDEQGAIFPWPRQGPYTWEEACKLVTGKWWLVIQREDQEGQERTDHIDWAARDRSRAKST